MRTVEEIQERLKQILEGLKLIEETNNINFTTEITLVQRLLTWIEE